MARYSEHSLGYEAFKSPPSIYGAEVSAEWKRNRRGEVIITVRMPHDAVDSEVYIKTPTVHSGIQMDPWTSSTWIKKWNPYHTPNKVIKGKLKKFRQERIYRCISLHKTAGRQQLFRNSCWSPRPNRRQRSSAFGLPANHPSGRQYRLNKVRNQSHSIMDKSPRKRTREMSPVRSIDDCWHTGQSLASLGTAGTW